MPATDTDLEQALLDPALVDELHAFLWTQPFSDRGTPDDGWSSREHVVVVGALLRTLGAEVGIRHGRCMFVRGPGSGSGLAVGIGQEGSARVGHAWLRVVGLGDVDLSPRLASPQPQREEPYDDDVAGQGLSWANSRVSQRLRARGLPEDLYRRFATHLLGLRAGDRQPLRGISPNKAWAIIAADAELAGRP